MLMRPDLRRPSSVKDDGPSTSTFFHGGETGFGWREASRVEASGSCTRRRLLGRSPLRVSVLPSM